MERGIITHISRGDKRNLPGRVSTWLQTPETTGGTSMSVCTCAYDAKAKALPVHSHPYGEETGYVVSGKGKVLIGGQLYDVEAGSVFLFPMGVPHSVWNTEDETLVIVFMYANGMKGIETITHEDIEF